MDIKFFLLFIFFPVWVFSQELPPVINYNPNEYQAGNQNWMVSQAPDKTIYVANSEGLLQYTGSEWNLYPMPNNTIVRSVEVVGDKIFTGAYMEFGYWMENTKGKLEYTSLTPKFPGNISDGEQFWHMEHVGEILVVQSFEGLYIYNLKTEEISRVKTPPLITNLFKGENSVYFQVAGEGLFTIKNTQPELVILPDILGDIELMHVSRQGNLLNLISRSGFFYTWNGETLTPNKVELSEKIRNKSVFSALTLKDHSLLLGTVEDGIYYINEQGDILYHFNQLNGLANNTVLKLFLDEAENVWAALDNGLSVINLDTPFKLFEDNNGYLGSVYASYKTDKYLYVGTNQGLFAKADGEKEFKFIEGTNGQVWSLQFIKGYLFCGHNNGTYVIREETAENIFDQSGTWIIRNYANHPGFYIQGHYNGISILEEKNGNFELVGFLKEFPHSSKYLISEPDGDIWIGNEHKGVFRLNLKESKTDILSVKNFTFGEVSGITSSIFKFNDTLYYSSKDQLFQYREKADAFSPESKLATIFDKAGLISGNIISAGNSGKESIWGFSENSIFNVEVAQLVEGYKINSVYLPKDLRNITLGFENILDLGNENFLLGISNGYLKFQKNVEISQDYDLRIEKIYSSTLDGTPILIDLARPPEFHYKSNNFSFNFSIPEYKKFLLPVYSYRLLGLGSVWSPWTGESLANFENLPFGQYTFQVRAKVGDQEIEPINFEFEIARPWYLHNLAIVIYVLLVFALAYFINKAYKRKHLKLIRENEKELKVKNLEAEKRIMELQNEQLEKDMTSKNTELAISTMSLIKKNEFLTSIKSRLEKTNGSAEVNSVIKTIDKDINQEDNWNFFKEAFDNADKDFFKKIKSRHPNLTSNDLKLCAYLRLNLSSKEIAPLLNISIKSVEIKRYRLRKKMDLPHEVNLVDYILVI